MSLVSYSYSCRAPATHPIQSSTLLRISSGTSPRITMSETARRPPGLQHPKRFAQNAILVGREIDDAVGDDHVHGLVGQGNALDFALEELDVLDARFALVLARQRQHLVGHVEAVGLAGGADAPRR